MRYYFIRTVVREREREREREKERLREEGRKEGRKGKRETWVPQLVKWLTLDFGSGHGLMVPEMEPQVGYCADSAEPV